MDYVDPREIGKLVAEDRLSLEDGEYLVKPI
jgi:hypothetical protein